MESEVIGGRYTILERLGKGAMGVVYKAHDPVLDRVVAVKKMIAEIGEDEELRQRFYVEARAAARLNHRHIVTIHELEEVDGEIYIVMELLEGVDLSGVIRRKVSMPLDAKLSIISQLCEGLEYAHQHGIVHRDIKPGNLHLSPHGVVKILDFGIARFASSRMTNTGALIGTPDYMSPEQVAGEGVDARSDLFAVGAVTYELVSGARPFESDSMASLLMKIARSPHTPLRERVPDVPDAVVGLVDRLMAKDREARPASAGVVVEELRAIAAEREASDTAATKLIGGIVAEQTLIRARQQVSRRDRASAGAQESRRRPTAAPTLESSNAKLASLALQRGRALRESGDLADAMEVFRSVLEVAPGNAEALSELQRLEHDLREATSGRQPTATEAVATPLIPPVPAVPVLSDGPPAIASALGHARRSALPLAIVATLVSVIIAATGAGAGWYFWSKRGDQGRSSAGAPVVRSTPSTPDASKNAPNPEGHQKPAQPIASAQPPITPNLPAASAAGAEAAASGADAARRLADGARLQLQELELRARMGQGGLVGPAEARELSRSGTIAQRAYEDGNFAKAAALYEESARRIQRLMVTPRKSDAIPGPASPGMENGSQAGARPIFPNVTSSAAPDSMRRPLPPEGARAPVGSDTVDTLTGRRTAQGVDIFNAGAASLASVVRIQAVLEEYARAMERRDAETVRSLRRDTTAQEQQILERGRQVSFRLEDSKVESNGVEGVATCRRVIEGTLDSGERITKSGLVTIRLVRLPRGWVITDIQ